MEKEVLYLCVDPDGIEKASEMRPKRLYEAMTEHVPQKYIDEHPKENYGPDQWIDSGSDTDYGYFGYDYSFDGICLPKGMIKKLIGKDLTWEDEPYEYHVLTDEEEEKVKIERQKEMIFDSLEDKCRYFQSLADYRLPENSFVIAHIDGRSFSKFIKNRFKKPFDEDFIEMMNETAKYLCANVSGVKCAYVQSDEISLLITDFNEESDDAEHFFGGRLCKMQSIIASMATSKFNRLFTTFLMTKDDVKDPLAVMESSPLLQFDCKCWSVPVANDAFAWFLFRQIDCVRNSKQQAAQSYLSHKELLGKNTDEQIEMLKTEKGIDWNDYPQGQKYGRLIVKRDLLLCRVNEDGTTDNFTRGKWVVEDGLDLTNPENKEKFLETVPVLKLDIDSINK